jgi:DNA end-binding protein Ku
MRAESERFSVERTRLRQFGVDAMARSTSWKGYLKLSLVSCAVAMTPAQSERDRVRFNTLNKATGNRLKQRLIDAGTGDVVEREDVTRGYEFAKGEHITVEDEDLEKVALPTKHTIDIEQFVPVDELDPLWMGDHHYLMPDDAVAEEAFAVIRDAMKENGVAGIARLIVSGRERYIVVRPRGKGVLLTTLRYPYEMRSEAEAFSRIGDADAPGDLVEAAREIMRQKTARFEPSSLTDRYQAALQKLLKAKQAGGAIAAPAPAKAAPEKVVGLFEALKRSIAAEKAAKPAKEERKPKKAAAPRAKAGGRSAA